MTLKCPHCNQEITDEDATICPHCGEPLMMQTPTMQSASSDLVLVAAVLTIVGAAFSAGLGYIALYQYSYLLSYYSSLSTSLPPQAVGFLIFGVVDVIASVIAIAGTAFMLRKKLVTISMMGIILLLVAAFVTVVSVNQYELGFTDTLLLSTISIIIFSIISAILVFKSRKEFT